jgi:hypothetical protein
MSRSRQALADSTESNGFRITLNVVCMQQKKISTVQLWTLDQ